MNSQDSKTTAQRAEAIYLGRLKSQLEVSQNDKFVAIEPVSGDYYLGETLSEAIAAARRAHPDRLAHVVRIGHKAGVQLGALETEK